MVAVKKREKKGAGPSGRSLVMGDVPSKGIVKPWPLFSLSF
jgi:hypothetical protein